MSNSLSPLQHEAVEKMAATINNIRVDIQRIPYRGMDRGDVEDWHNCFHHAIVALQAAFPITEVSK